MHKPPGFYHSATEPTKKPTTSTEDFLGLKIELKAEDREKFGKFVSEHSDKPSLVRELCQFGWNVDTITFLANGETSLIKAFYILTNGIKAPLSNYYYHGTSSTFYNSIKESGLNNGKSPVINRGIIEHKENKTTYTTDFFTAYVFAKSTSMKVGGDPLVVRWAVKHKSAILKGISGRIDAVDAAELEFCEDAAASTWVKECKKPGPKFKGT